jgi:hypothetical protein
METTTKKRIARKPKANEAKSMGDYSNDPFFVKKREASLKILQKTGLPESFRARKNNL